MKDERLFCEDEYGFQYELVEIPYIPGKGNHACMGCDLLIRGVCKMIKTCTPKDKETGKNLIRDGKWRKVPVDS